MTENLTPREHNAAKAAVFVSCLIVGGIVAVLVSGLLGSLLGCFSALVLGFAAAFMNPFIAASAADAAERLEAWSSPDSYEPWTFSKKAYTGAGWPVTLPYWVIVSSFYWSINQHFPPP